MISACPLLARSTGTCPSAGGQRRTLLPTRRRLIAAGCSASGEGGQGRSEGRVSALGHRQGLPREREPLQALPRERANGRKEGARHRHPLIDEVEASFQVFE